MSEANKQLVKRWFDEISNKGRHDAIAEMLAPEAIIWEGYAMAKGPEGFYGFFDRMLAPMDRDAVFPMPQVVVTFGLVRHRVKSYGDWNNAEPRPRVRRKMFGRLGP